MASTSKTSIVGRNGRTKKRKRKDSKEEIMNTSEDPKVEGEAAQQAAAPEPGNDDLMDFGDLDFADHYGDDAIKDESQLLPKNTAQSAINCAFVGFGGGGGKLAKSFLDLGYNRTLLINTTHKDQPDGIEPQHFLLLEGADGVGKDVAMGKRILNDNATFIEDTLRARLGAVDWIFVCASGGGGTGSASASIHDAFQRYLDSVQGNGKVVYLVSTPTSQELLNPTIKSNCALLCEDVKQHPHVVVDNEKQLQLLRGKVGMLGMYPAANKAFSKMLAQIFKLAAESSPIQTFDTKDLEKCLATPGRMFLGTIAVKDFRDDKLGMKIFKGCTDRSPCPAPAAKAGAGVLLLVTSTDTASDPTASNQMEAAISYVGGRSDTLFSGVYVRKGLPGLVAIMALCGM